MKKYMRRSQSGAPTPIPPHVLQVILSNGKPEQDVKLQFEFSRRFHGDAQLWLVSLPALKNPDSFPKEFGPGEWELRLDAVSDTQPVTISHITRETAQQWLEASKNLTPAELIILCHENQFTVTIQQDLAYATTC